MVAIKATNQVSIPLKSGHIVTPIAAVAAGMVYGIVGFNPLKVGSYCNG